MGCSSLTLVINLRNVISINKTKITLVIDIMSNNKIISIFYFILITYINICILHITWKWKKRIFHFLEKRRFWIINP